MINIRENPVINRIILEGNKRLKDDKITPEIKLAPRQIFTRSAVRADVDRILELYRRQGRFGARVDPKIVQLDQNRVDVVFEIYEGDLAKVRAINILGNTHYSDSRLRKEMYTKQAGGVLGFMKSNDTYDPDRLAADQQKLRAFYLTQGYADFRVVQALAELTPDRKDFVITYVVEEGPRYKFGTVEADSALRDFPNAKVLQLAKIKPGGWFNAKEVEDSVTNLNEAAGALGYAFADINPAYDRDAEKRLMNLTIKVTPTPRVYVERIDVTGNTSTRDKVIRREFRINEGDAFNALKVKRSQDRLQSLGYFQEKLEIKQTEGSAPDRVVLGVNVEEKPTGQLSLSGGYSSLERFVVQAAISQNNFMGKGQTLNASADWSLYSKSIEAGLRRPLFPRQVDPARRQPVPARLSQLQFARRHAQHDLFAGQHRRHPAPRLPDHRILEHGRPLHAAAGPGVARSVQLLYRSRRHRAASGGLRPGEGRAVPVRRTRQPADLLRRLLDHL